MYTKKISGGYATLIDGIDIKTLVHGEKTLLAEFLLHAGYIIPRHAHPHEQTGYMVSGMALMTIGHQTYEMQPGDSWSIAGGIAHSVEVLEDSIVIEVFSPVREDYLPYQIGESENFD